MTYFCLLFDRPGHVRAVEPIIAVSDAEALDQAAAIQYAAPECLAYEVWEHGRTVRAAQARTSHR